MIALARVVIHSKIYESSVYLVYRTISVQDNQAIARSALPEAIVAKLLKQNYPSSQELTRYRQECEITRSLNLKSPHVLEGTLPFHEPTCAKCHEQGI